MNGTTKRNLVMALRLPGHGPEARSHALKPAPQRLWGEHCCIPGPTSRILTGFIPPRTEIRKLLLGDLARFLRQVAVHHGPAAGLRQARFFTMQAVIFYVRDLVADSLKASPVHICWASEPKARLEVANRAEKETARPARYRLGGWSWSGRRSCRLPLARLGGPVVDDQTVPERPRGRCDVRHTGEIHPVFGPHAPVSMRIRRPHPPVSAGGQSPGDASPRTPDKK